MQVSEQKEALFTFLMQLSTLCKKRLGFFGLAILISLNAFQEENVFLLFVIFLILEKRHSFREVFPRGLRLFWEEIPRKYQI